MAHKAPPAKQTHRIGGPQARLGRGNLCWAMDISGEIVGGQVRKEEKSSGVLNTMLRSQMLPSSSGEHQRV